MHSNDGMLEQYVTRRGQRLLRERQDALASLRTAGDLAEQKQRITSKTRELIGELPENAPLSVREIGVLQREDYSLITLTYAGLPGTTIPANLYIPRGRPEPYPAVIVLSGDAVEGKVQADRQRLGQFLARRGIATLLMDGPGGGERLEFYDSTLRRSWLGKSCAVERANLAYPMLLTGHSLAAWEAYEAMRGFDVLASREDIDAQKLGIAGEGSSEGVVRLLCCLEARLKAAAIVSDFCDPVGGEHIEDTLPGLLSAGLDWDDMLLAFAPKPLLLICCPHMKPGGSALKMDALGKQLAPRDGTLRRAYELSNAPKKLFLEEERSAAGFSRPLRQRMADHFALAFGSGEERIRETELPHEPVESLRCTETGQVCNSLNSPSLFSIHARLAEALPPELRAPETAAQAEEFRETMRAKILSILRMPESELPVTREVESRASDWGLNVEKGRLVIAEDLYVPYRFFAAPALQGEAKGSAPVLLALHERGIAGVSGASAWMNQIPQAGFHVMAIDVAGVGETRLQAERDEDDGYEAALCGAESLWASRALNCGLNLFGLAVFSVLRTAEHLRSRPEVGKSGISISGTGRGALWALYAAALSPYISKVALLRGLTSYKCLAERARNNHHFSMYLPGVLKAFDLPHVAACVAPRPLAIINAVDQRKERNRTEKVLRKYEFAAATYRALDAETNLTIVSSESAPETLGRVMKGIGATGNS